MAAYREEALYGRWVHSHEEDTDDALVFRPADRPMPPARGRTAFELRRDGTYVERSPGPVDAPVQSTGSWSLEGDRLVLGADGDRPGHAWVVASLEKDRLAVKR